MLVGKHPIKGSHPWTRSTIGLDLAKHVFQVHGVDGSGAPVLRKQLQCSQVVAFFAALPRYLVGLEACATAHYWA
jgi:transposase